MKTGNLNCIKFITGILMLCFLQICHAQNTFPTTGSAGIGTTTPYVSSALEIKSTTEGILIPRMTFAQRNAIPVSSAGAGLLIYQTNNTPGFYYYNGTGWNAISTKGANLTLSNLGAATAINSNLLPKIDDSINIGSNTFRYKNINLFNLDFADASVQTTAFKPYTNGTGINISGTTISNTAPDQTVVLNNGTGISVTGTYPNFTVSNSAPDKTVTLTGSGATTISGTYPNFTIASTDNNTTYTAGTGINISGTTITNSSPDKTVALTGGTGISVTGVYPSFTITNTALTNGGAWSLTGNAGTDSSINFIGTTDGHPLELRVNNIGAGFIDNSTYNTGTRNTAFGLRSLISNTTGIENTANGYGSLYSNQNGNDNSALGKYSLFTNTSGSYNTALGFNAMFFNTSGTNNTATGSLALQNNNTSSNNTADGYSALYSNNGGNYNTAIGVSAMQSNTMGVGNTATGALALQNNLTGNDNVADGYESMYNATGSYNTGTGSFCLYNSSGNNNVSNGYESLFENTTGNNNTAVGYSSLWANTSGNNNTAIGSNTLFNNTQGFGNVAMGNSALFTDVNGIYDIAIGDSALFHTNESAGSFLNVGLGAFTLYYNTIGFNNIACGTSALSGNTTGKNNIEIGSSLGGAENQTGIYNTFLGQNYYPTLIDSVNVPITLSYGAPGPGGFPNGNINFNTGLGAAALGAVNGNGNTAVGCAAGNSFPYFATNSYPDYHYCTYLGIGALSSASSETNSTAIGNGAIVDASNKVRIGNTAVTSIGGQVGWTTFSDGRFKKNIKPDVLGLAFINSLQPVTYTLDINGINAYYDKNRKSDSAYAEMKKEMQPSEDTAAKIVYNGFIAQDVEATANKLGYQFSGVDKPKSKDGLYGLRYSDFVVPLVKAVQELSAINGNKQQQIDSLKIANANQQVINSNQQSSINNLQQQLNELRSIVLSMQQCSPCNNDNGPASSVMLSSTVSGAVLEQNVPNPFGSATTIGYTLPKAFTSAAIMITDKYGRTLKMVKVSGSGKGIVNVDASTLSGGAYNYSLLVDGKLVATKQMILAK